MTEDLIRDCLSSLGHGLIDLAGLFILRWLAFFEACDLPRPTTKQLVGLALVIFAGSHHS